MEQIAGLTLQIQRLDQKIEALAERYPEIVVLRTAPGVGPVIAAAYVLTLDRVDAVANSRSVGAFLGLRPRQSQSGDSDPEHNISKTGNIYLAPFVGASGAPHSGPVWTRFGATPVGIEAGPGRKTGQETGGGGGGPQTGSHFAPHVANGAELPALPGTDSSGRGCGLVFLEFSATGAQRIVKIHCHLAFRRLRPAAGPSTRPCFR